jgi:Sulfotransferase family
MSLVFTIVVIVAVVLDPKSVRMTNYSLRNETFHKVRTPSRIHYQNTSNSVSIPLNNYSWSLHPEDFIYRSGSWDGAPIVLEEYKLIFFTVAKVGCTVWKQLFRRMMGYSNWKSWNWKTHDPSINGLIYLYHYSLDEANYMLQSTEWTKAIFVRDPPTRILSAYLDKGRRHNGSYVQHHCCPSQNTTCGWRASQSFESFLQTILVEYSNQTQCIRDPHWMRMTDRLPHSLLQWLESTENYALKQQQLQHINDLRPTTTWFVGHMETLADDARRLLQKVGAWEEYGASGWSRSKGENRSTTSDEIFQSNSATHATDASQLLSSHYELSSNSLLIQQLVLQFYAPDYDMDFENDY